MKKLSNTSKQLILIAYDTHPHTRRSFIKKSHIIGTFIVSGALLLCSACGLAQDYSETPSASVSGSETVAFEYSETEYNGAEYIIIEGYEPPVNKYIFVLTHVF